MIFKKLLFFLICMVFQSSLLFSDDAYISLSTGFGDYSMEPLKEINEAHIANTPYEDILTKDFPLSPYYKVSITNITRYNFSIGVSYTYQSTESRIQYIDEAVEIHNNILVNAHFFGVLLEYTVFSHENFKFDIYSELGFMATDVDFHQSLSASGQSTIMKDHMDIDCSFAEPGIKAIYNLGRFVCGATLCYCSDNWDDEKLDEGWNGYKFGIELSYYIRKDKKKDY